MCVVNSIACPTKWADGMAAGIDWYNGFMKIHPRLSLRTPEGCSLARATSFNPHNVMQFYNNLEIIMQREPKFGDGTRIFNLNETGTTTVHIPPKVIAEKGVKQVSSLIATDTPVKDALERSGKSRRGQSPSSQIGALFSNWNTILNIMIRRLNKPRRLAYQNEPNE